MTVDVTPEFRDRIRSAVPGARGRHRLSRERRRLAGAGGGRRSHPRLHGLELCPARAGYALSQKATAMVDEAHDFVRLLFNGADGEVILGPSTSALLQMLATSYSKVLTSGDEVVVAQIGHEANVGPWKKLVRFRDRVGWWEMDTDDHDLAVAAPRGTAERTDGLVAFPHVSNLLGEILDVSAHHRDWPTAPAPGWWSTGSPSHPTGRWMWLPGTSTSTPTRPTRSTDRTWRPCGRAARPCAELQGPNHFFIPDTEVPYKFELGGVSHEGCAGILGLRDYLDGLAGVGEAATLDRAAVEHAFEVMTACELPLQQRLVEYLQSRSDVRIIGPAHGGPHGSAPSALSTTRRPRARSPRWSTVPGSPSGTATCTPTTSAKPSGWTSTTAWCGSAWSTTTPRRRSSASSEFWQALG